MTDKKYYVDRFIGDTHYEVGCNVYDHGVYKQEEWGDGSTCFDIVKEPEFYEWVAYDTETGDTVEQGEVLEQLIRETADTMNHIYWERVFYDLGYV